MIIRDTSSGKVLLDNVVEAKSFITRTRGLLGRRELGPGEGMLFPGCVSIHTFFMLMPIDVLFLDREYTVVDIRENLVAWQITRCTGAGGKHTLEIAPGNAARLEIKVGSKLMIG